MEFYIGIETERGGVRTSAPLKSFVFASEVAEYVECLMETYPGGKVFIRVI